MALSPYTIKISQQGKELVSHGTPAFPAACYLDDLNLEPSPWHWHEELEAGVVSEGTVLISAGGNTVSLTAGAGFFINSGTLHMIAPASAGPCHVHSIVFHPRIIGGTPETVFWQKYLHPLIHHMTEFVYFMNPDTGLHDALLNQSGGSRNGSGCCSKAASPAGTAYPGTDQSFISTVCEEIEYCWHLIADEPPGFEIDTRYRLSRLARLLTEHLIPAQDPQSPPYKTARDSMRIKNMLQYIQNHYSSRLTVGEIAASAAISESEALRCFRRTIGITPAQYILQFRIQEAANLLRTTDNKITDIGSACGFQDTSYFVKRFREFKHCTPGVYRKKNSLRRFNRTEPDITPALPAAQSRNSVPCLPSRGWRQM